MSEPAGTYNFIAEEALIMIPMTTNLQLVRKDIWAEVPLIISTMPRQFGPSATPAEDDMGAWISAELDRIMEEFLVEDAERELWAQRADAALPASLWSRLDELIIRQTESLGDLIEHSAVVQLRIRHWKEMLNGVKLYRRYNAARDKNMRHLHRRGGSLPPVDPRFKAFKVATVSELRVVLPDLQVHFATFRRRATPQELIARFHHTIGQRQCMHLQANQPSWESFFAGQTRHQTVESLINQKPASLFDAWAAWATTYKPEVLRQKIARQKL
jgi:hypothetical protein